MLKTLVCSIAVSGCLGFTASQAMAQQVVHALTGTVSSINSASKTISVFQDNGTQGDFSDGTDSKARLSIDKRVTFDSTSGDAFKKTGAYVVVLYYGGDSDRTAVALKNLGSGPFTSVTGTVVKFDSKKTIQVLDSSGETQNFKIAQDTIGEGYMGAVDGYKLQAQKGDKVRIVGSKEDGGLTALFVRLM
jgi:rhodanese-related sulfurtransferase